MFDGLHRLPGGGRSSLSCRSDDVSSNTTRTALVHKLGIGAEVAIFCTKGRPARSRALALRVGREDTLTCPTGEVVTLNAIRVILRRGRVKAGEEDNCRCYEGNKHYAYYACFPPTLTGQW